MKSRLRRTRKVILWFCIMTSVLTASSWFFSWQWGLIYTVRTEFSESDLNSDEDSELLAYSYYGLKPTLTIILVDGQLFYGSSPVLSFLDEGLEIAWQRYERSDLIVIAYGLDSLTEEVGASSTVPLTLGSVPLWIPLALSLLIGIPLFLTSRRNLPRRTGVTSGEWVKRKRATWKRTAISAPILVMSLIVTPFLMVWAITALFPNTEVDNELRRRLGVSDSTLVGIFMAAWLALSYTIARIAFALTAWTRIRIFGEGHIPCARCGYDLMGNTSGICPECGMAIQPEHKATT